MYYTITHYYRVNTSSSDVVEIGEESDLDELELPVIKLEKTNSDAQVRFLPGEENIHLLHCLTGKDN